MKVLFDHIEKGDNNIEHKLVPPCAYQGGKQRIANKIVDIIYKYSNINDNIKFYDLCCGSGSVSIEMVNHEFLPFNITMVDKSPWGLFWKQVGNGTFSTDVFKYYLDDIPKDLSKIKGYMQGLADTPVYNTQTDITYLFLMLQASAFGSTATWIENEHWKKAGGLRNYWQPTKTSNRRSPVNPMMPMPDSLLERCEQLVMGMEGVNGYYDDCNNIKIEPNSIIYIDPPYDKTTKYGYDFDYMSFINTYKKTNTIFLSEGKQLSDIAFNLTDRRSKGGISGNRKTINEEWLNVFIR